MVKSLAVNPEVISSDASHLTQQQSRWAFAALFLALAGGGTRDALVLFKYPFAVGVDGYYYLLQIATLQNQGHLYFHTRAPLILYALTAFSNLIGNPILAIKIGSIALHVALCAGIFALIMSVTRSHWLGVLGSVLAAASGAHFYMVGEYIGNLGALAFLIWSGWCATRVIQTRNNVWAVLSAIGFVAASFSHRSIPAIAFMIVISVVLMNFLIRARSSGQSYRAIVALIILALWCAPAILAAQPFIHLPVWIERELLIAPRLPLSQAAIAEQVIVLVVAPATLILILLKQESRVSIANLFLGSVALWSLLITVNPFLNNKGAMNFTWRLSTLAYIQVAILVPGLIWLVLSLRRESAILIAAFVLPLMIGSARYSLPYGMRPEYLSQRAELLRRLPFFRQQLEQTSLVISPHGEQFIVTSVLGIASQQHWPDNNTYQPIYWLLHHVEPRFYTSSMILLMKENDGSYTMLAKDADVQQRLAAITDIERKRLFMSNPYLYEHMSTRAELN